MSAGGVRRGLPNQETQSGNARPRRLRRGERRRLTREDINADIRRKEEELANLLESRNALKKMQRDQRAATIEAYKEKDSNQVEVARSYKDISAKSEEMHRIKSLLIYQQAYPHDEAIRRIEGQLRVNNFKLSDEKRLVQEIDGLRKSKRDLTKYQQMRTSLDEIRARQRVLKSRRDESFEKIKASRRKEDELKRKIDELLPEINQLKRTIEELQQRRQQLEVGASSSSGDEGCQTVTAAGVDGDRSEAGSAMAGGGVGADVTTGSAGSEVASIEIEFEDFDERASEAEELATLCRSLILYLRNFRTDWAAVAAAAAGGDSSSSGGGEVGASLLGASGVAANVGPGGSGEQQRRRQGARKLQRSERALTHPPDVFAQFYRLSIPPPTRAAEIPACLQRLTNALDAKTAEGACGGGGGSSSGVGAGGGGGGGAETRDKSPASTATTSPAGPSTAVIVGYARSLSNPSNDESGFSETTSVRPESPEPAGSRLPAPPAPLSSEVAGTSAAAGAGTDDLLSTSSTVCSEDNPTSSATESPPLPPSAATA